MYLYLTIGTILLLSGWVMVLIARKDDQYSIFITGCFLLVAGVVFILAMVCTLPHTYYKKKFINSVSERQYTMDEIFWNYKDIKSIVIGKKQRFELEIE